MKTARMIKIFTFLSRAAGLKFAVDELASVLNIPERSLYEYLEEMASEQLIEIHEEGGKRRYTIRVLSAPVDIERAYSISANDQTSIGAAAPSTAEMPETIHATRIEEIVSRYKYLRKIEREGGQEKVRSLFRELDPRKEWESARDELINNDKIRALYPWVSVEELKSLEIRGASFFTTRTPPKSDEVNGVFIGTDGSLNRVDLVFQVFQIPTMMNLVFTSAAAVKIAIENGEKIPVDASHEITKVPAYPMYSAEEYVEDLGTAYPHLSEGERGQIAYTMMDSVHFGIDSKSIMSAFLGIEAGKSDVSGLPTVLFHDGRVVPSNISHLDFIGLHPRPGNVKDREHNLRARKTWEALSKVVSVRETAIARKIRYAGVVKRPAKPYFSLIVDRIISREFGIPRGEIRNDTQAMSLLLKSGESSCAVLVDPRKVYIDDARKDALKEIFQLDFDSYERYLELLRHWAFYLNSSGYVCRYEFFDDGSPPEPTLADLSRNALALASPSTRGDVTSLYSPKRLEIVPSPVAAADAQANAWGAKVGSMLEGHILTALKGALAK